MVKPCICGMHQRSKKDRKPIVDKVGIGSTVYVFCQNCGVEGGFANTEDEAIHKWNEEIKSLKEDDGYREKDSK